MSGTDELELTGSARLVRLRGTHRRKLEDAVARVREVLPSLPGVRRVSLFGSYARGRADLFTDLDVLVVRETNEGFVVRHGELYRALALPVDLDLICYTPEEFDEMRERPFLREALREEVVLYEAPAG